VTQEPKRYLPKLAGNSAGRLLKVACYQARVQHGDRESSKPIGQPSIRSDGKLFIMSRIDGKTHGQVLRHTRIIDWNALGLGVDQKLRNPRTLRTHTFW